MFLFFIFYNTMWFKSILAKDEKESNSPLKLYLTVIFVVVLLVSIVITGRQILLPFGITMTGAILVFPITYILSDVFSEVY